MWLVCRGLHAGWIHTFGAIFNRLASLSIGIPHLGSIHPFGVLGGWSNDVANALANLAAGYESAMGFWFHQAARLQLWIADETWGLAKDTYNFGSWLVHTFVPTYVHGLTHIAHTTINTTTRVTHVTETKVIHLTKTVVITAKNAAAHAIPQVTIPHIAEWQWIHRHWKALTAALAAAGAIALHPPLAIPRLWRGIDDVESEARKLAKRLHKVEALLGATAMAAAIANVLGIKSANCLRKGPLGKVARRLCGLSSNALNDILGLLVDFLIVTDICEVITLLNQGLSVIEGPLKDLTGVVDAALCHGDYTKPPAMPVPGLRGNNIPAVAVLGV